MVEPTLVAPPLARDAAVVKTPPPSHVSSVTMATVDSTSLSGADKAASVVISTTIRSTPTQPSLPEGKLTTNQSSLNMSCTKIRQSSTCRVTVVVIARRLSITSNPYSAYLPHLTSPRLATVLSFNFAYPFASSSQRVCLWSLANGG